MVKKKGRPRKTAEDLKASGSWRAKKRAKEESGEAPAAPVTSPQPQAAYQPPTDAELDRLIRTLPGYDPFRDSAGCWFDCDAARRAIKFFETKLCHVEGAAAGKPFLLEPWERAIIACLFGWKRKDANGNVVRRYRVTLIYVPRKNGKTPLCAGICLYLLFEDGEVGAQIVSAAAERGQAALLFRHARGMVERSEALGSLARIYGGMNQRAIQLVADKAASYQAISADAHTKHGYNLHAGIVDELHAQPDRDLVDTLTTSMSSANRLQPLMAYITTADFQRPSICNEIHDYATKVRDGIVCDSSFLPVIYEAPRDADWTDPEVWRAANPNLGVSVSLDYLKRECQRAKETPTYENTFRRLHLNQQTEQDVRWLPMDAWDECGASDPAAWRAKALSDLARSPASGGLDLSTSLDVTAFVLAISRGRNIVLLPFFWVPKEQAHKRERNDRVPYLTWSRQGFVKLTEGNRVDYDVVRKDIADLGRQFNIRGIAFDRWNSNQIVQQLSGDGLSMFEMGQGFQSFTAPCKEFEALVADRRLEHGGNPMLRWMASNAAAEIDAAGNIKPSKKKSTERIDGIVAGVMALAHKMSLNEPEFTGRMFYC